MAIEMTGGRSYLLKEASLTEDNSKKIQLYLYVVESRSEDNFFDSILNLGLYVKTSPADYSVGPWTALENAGSSLAGKYFNGSIPEFSGTYWLISNVTKIVSHDENFGMAATHIPWNWDVNPPFINIDQPSGNKELVLNLKYSKPYRVFFNCSGGSFGFRAVHKYHGCSVTLPYEVPTKEDTNFVGWGLTPDTTEVAYYPEDVYTADESITLYAIWEPKTYTIRFDACGGSVDCYAKSKTHGNSIALPGLTAGTAKPIKLGYNFIGWSTLADGASQDYIKDGDTYSTDKSTTLYAIWEATTYTIQYDANGGTDAPNNQIKEFGQDIELATSEPNRPGYTFRGWAISPDSPDIYYIPGQSYNINASLNLYAIWKINTYEIKYNANGGINVPETQIKIYDEDITISSVIPVRPEYRFEGWTITSTNTEVYYKAGDIYSNNESVTLYAIWTPGITYDIKYYDYSDTDEHPYSLVQEKLHGVALALSNSIPARDGCTFIGWACDPENTDIIYQLGDIYSKNESVVLYPIRFKEIVLRYYANGGYNVPDANTPIKCFNDAVITTPKQLEELPVSFEISELIPERGGYIFKNWITSTGKTYKAKDSIECSKDTALFAQWTPIPYTLTIDPNGGHHATKDTESFTISTQCGEIYHLEPLQREGYRLVGFTLEPEGNEIVFDNASQTFIYTQGACDVTATAQWEINTYDVVFDANGGTGAPDPQVKIHGETLRLSNIKPVKENYVFSCWSPSRSNTSTKYCYGDPIHYRYEANESVTLYAIWEPKSYRVAYALSDNNVDSTVFKFNSKIHGQDFILSLNTAIPGREKYEFFGWSTSPEATTVVYEPNEAYTVDADIVLYPVLGYKVTCNLNGGSGISSSQIKIHGQTLYLGQPIRPGYTLSGWRDEAGTKYDPEKGCYYTKDRPINLTCLWTPDTTAVKCTIRLDPNGGTWNGVSIANDKNLAFVKTTNGEQVEQKVYYHEEDPKITAVIPIRTTGTTKYFVGWNTEADGSGYWYGANLSHDIETLTTLYAQWASKTEYGGQLPLPVPIIHSVTQVENTNTIEVFCAARHNGTTNGFYALAFEIYAADPVSNLGVFEVLIASGIVYKVLPGDTLYSDYSFQIHLGDNLADYIKSLFSSKGGSLGFKYQVTLQSLGTAGAKYNSPKVLADGSFAYCRKPESPFNIKITDFDLSKSSISHPLTLSYIPSTLRLSEVNYDFRKAYVNERLSQGACYIRVADITDGSVILEDPIEVSDSGAYFNLEECLDSAGKSFEFGHVYSFTAENRVRYQASLSSNTVVSKSVEVSSDQILLGYIKLEEKIPFDEIIPIITSINALPTTNLFDGERAFFSTSKRAEGPNYDIKISWPEATSIDNKLESYELILFLLDAEDRTIGEYRINLKENEYYLDLEKIFGALPTGIYVLKAQINTISVYGQAYSTYGVDYDLVYLIHGTNCPYIDIPGEPVKRRVIAYVKVPDPENSETTRWVLASDYLIKEKNQGWKPGYSDYEMLVDENNEIILDEDDNPIYAF